MNKGEFIKAIAEKASLSQKQADEALAAFINTVQEELKKGEKIQLVGFGTFDLQDRAAREGINPLTKEPLHIPASRVPKLKFGKSFKSQF